MDLLPVIVIGVVAIVLITTIAPKFGIAAPLILVVIGAAVGLLPFVPEVHIEPEWILGGVLPPLLYSAAVNTPTMGFRRDLWMISVFAVLLVAASAISVGFVLTWLIPDLPLAIGIAVGAVVSPTDAVATGIVTRSGVSTRIVDVLDGEALFNDATALVLVRSAIAAVAASVTLWDVTTDFLYSLAVAVLIGVVVGRFNVAIRSHIPDTASNVAFSLAVPFLAAIPAEHINASGLVAAVVAGMITGQRIPKRLSSEVRIAGAAVWETISHVLESGIFLVMGLQLYTLIQDIRVTSDNQLTAIEIGVVVISVLIAIRAAFVFGSVWLRARRSAGYAIQRQRMVEFTEHMNRVSAEQQAGTDRKPINRRRWENFQDVMARRIADIDYLANEQFGAKHAVVLVAAGMRGAITLAAAQLLPVGAPHRSLLILIAFVVAAGTLIVQGGTLPALVRALKLPTQDPGTTARVMQQLGNDLNQAVMRKLDEGSLTRRDGKPFSEAAIAHARTMLKSRLSPESVPERKTAISELTALRLEIVEASRSELLRIRDRGTYSSDVLSVKLAQLDADQVSIEARLM